MSRATKRKHVTKEVLEEVIEPTGAQLIVKVLCGRGNNLHEVQSCNGETFLVSMPRKYRRNVWIKRGDFVIVEPILEGHKVQAEIVHILYPMQIKELKIQNKWPQEFNDDIKTPVASESHDQSCDSDDDDIFVNTNRQNDSALEFTSSDTD